MKCSLAASIVLVAVAGFAVACGNAAGSGEPADLATPAETGLEGDSDALNVDGGGDRQGPELAVRADRDLDDDSPAAVEGDPPPVGTLQSPEEALAQDLALIAETRGWTMEEALANHQAAEIVGSIAGQIADERPDAFIGPALSSDPRGVPSLYIKGPADEFVRSLVAEAEIEIRIVDNQPFSFEEMQERQSQVVRALQAQGFQNFAVGFRLEERGQIRAAVTLEPGLPDDVEEILAGLPASLRDSVTLTLSDEPVAVDE